MQLQVGKRYRVEYPPTIIHARVEDIEWEVVEASPCSCVVRIWHESKKKSRRQIIPQDMIELLAESGMITEIDPSIPPLTDEDIPF
jgi:hypothetical protein